MNCAAPTEQRQSQHSEEDDRLGHGVAGMTERYAEYVPNYQAKARAAIEKFEWQVQAMVRKSGAGSGD